MSVLPCIVCLGVLKSDFAALLRLHHMSQPAQCAVQGTPESFPHQDLFAPTVDTDIETWLAQEWQ